MEITNNNKRNKIIDIAKGIGIITVVWAHMQQSCPIRNEIYIFHMPLFFILSGYFFKDTDIKFIDLLKKRIQSYIIPYIIFIFIGLFIFVCLYKITGRSDKIHIYPGIIIHPYGVVGALWFLISLFEVHIGYYMINKVIKKEIWKFACCLSLFLVGYILYKTKIHLPLYIDTSFSMIIFFHIGYYLNKHPFWKLPISKLWLVISISLLFYSIGIVQDIRIDMKTNILNSDSLIALTAITGACFLIIYLSYIINRYGKHVSYLFCYLGENSLLIFALHLLCIEIVRCTFNLPGNESENYIQGIWLTIIAIIGSILIGKPIKKYIINKIKLI